MHTYCCCCCCSRTPNTEQAVKKRCVQCAHNKSKEACGRFTCRNFINHHCLPLLSWTVEQQNRREQSANQFNKQQRTGLWMTGSSRHIIMIHDQEHNKQQEAETRFFYVCISYEFTSERCLVIKSIIPAPTSRCPHPLSLIIIIRYHHRHQLILCALCALVLLCPPSGRRGHKRKRVHTTGTTLASGNVSIL